MHIFKTLVQGPDLEWSFIDGSIIKAHQHSAGLLNKEEQGIGKSVAGNTTKIHMAVDAHGLPIDFQITGGEVHDCKVAPEFIEKLPFSEYTIADKGYDSEEVRDIIRKKSSIPVIPRKSNSKIGNSDRDWGLYKYRHLVENLFARIKHFRAIATRFDKLKRNYASLVAMACAFLWLPM
jgi:transposase